jgi:hypothetical protein
VKSGLCTVKDAVDPFCVEVSCVLFRHSTKRAHSML